MNAEIAAIAVQVIVQLVDHYKKINADLAAGLITPEKARAAAKAFADKVSAARAADAEIDDAISKVT